MREKATEQKLILMIKAAKGWNRSEIRKPRL
jgi:hypothetical protein